MSGGNRARFAQINSAKAKFEEIYTAPDPRPYCTTLGALDYCIPGRAAPVFSRLVEALRARRGRRRIRCLDLGCSYGINAALLKYHLSWEQLLARWSGVGAVAGDSAGRRLADRSFFAAAPRDAEIETIGLDVSAPAVRYAEGVGILDRGLVENLETSDPSPELRELLADCDLVISTGAVGYLTQATFTRLAACFGRPAPWIASFVLRMFEYDAIAAALGGNGMATETLEGRLFAQRRFRDRAEREGVLAQLRAAGLDPAPEVANDGFLARFFLTRPREDASPALADLFDDLPAGDDQKASTARISASVSSVPARSK